MNGDNSSKRVFEKRYKLCLFPKTRTVKYLKNHFFLELVKQRPRAADSYSSLWQFLVLYVELLYGHASFSFPYQFSSMAENLIKGISWQMSCGP